MLLTREEKEKLLLDLYYNKGYTYRQITTELKMSPNQIRDIIRRYEEKGNAIASRKRELSLSSKAYKLYSKGKNRAQVAIMLNIPEPQATQFHFEYFRLTGQDELISLYARTKGKLSSLLKLFDELAVNRGMSIEHIANVVEISLHKLPYMESLHDQVKREVDRLEEKRDYMLFNINSLKKELSEEEKRQRRMLALPSYNNYYHNDKGGREFPTATSSHYNYDRRPISFMLPESPPPPELAD
ncbi:MAG TPA: helix-turn-helix domain-containing protein [Nitrososphaeraceae archaeon]